MNGLSSKSNQPVSTHRRPGRSKEKRKSKHKLKKRVSRKERVWVGEIDGKPVSATRPKTGGFEHFKLETETQTWNKYSREMLQVLSQGLLWLLCWVLGTVFPVYQNNLFSRGATSLRSPVKVWTPQPGWRLSCRWSPCQTGKGKGWFWGGFTSEMECCANIDVFFRKMGHAEISEHAAFSSPLPASLELLSTEERRCRVHL